MSRLVLTVLGVLLLSANAWAIPKEGEDTHALGMSALEAEMCLLLQDPWQDCDEDPWQLTSVQNMTDTCSDPGQDADDPWQPIPAMVPAGATPDFVDPWQPLVSQMAPAGAVMPDLSEDPWQPTFEAWQENAGER